MTERRSLLRSLRAADAQLRAAEPPPRVKHAVLAALDAQVAGRRRATFWALPAVAAAAAALAAIAGGRAPSPGDTVAEADPPRYEPMDLEPARRDDDVPMPLAERSLDPERSSSSPPDMSPLPRPRARRPSTPWPAIPPQRAYRGPDRAAPAPPPSAPSMRATPPDPGLRRHESAVFADAHAHAQAPQSGPVPSAAPARRSLTTRSSDEPSGPKPPSDREPQQPPDRGPQAPPDRGPQAPPDREPQQPTEHETDPDIEVHVIGIYEAGGSGDAREVSVYIALPGTHIVVLSAYASTTWRVTAAPSADIERLVVTGMEAQYVASAPPGVAIEIINEETGRRFFGCGYEWPDRDPQSGCETPELLSELQDYLKLPIASFHGCYAGSSFVLRADGTASGACETAAGYFLTGFP